MTALVDGFLGEYKGPADMVLVPEGEFVYQKDQRISLPAFEMDRKLVTNWDFERMIPARERDGRSAGEQQPVVNVNWYEARLYARWRGSRLPGEHEWEKAARGTEGREYPWGNKFDAAKCNTADSQIGATTPVGKYRNGASPYGCLDMAGNVWEWMDDWYDDREEYRVLRGGSWYDFHGLARSAFRNYYLPAGQFNVIGFRCARTT